MAELEEGVGVAAPVALGDGVVESIMSSLDCILKDCVNRTGFED